MNTFFNKILAVTVFSLMTIPSCAMADLGALQVEQVSSTCPRSIKKFTYISNFVDISVGTGVTLKVGGRYTSLSPIGQALRGQKLVGSGKLKVKGFTLRQSRRAKIKVNGQACTLTTTVRANKTLNDAGFRTGAPLIPVGAKVSFSCPKVACSSTFEGTLDHKPA